MSTENPYASPESDVAVEEHGALAGRGARLGGALIDTVLTIAIVLPVSYATGYWNDISTTGTASVGDALVLSLVGIVAFLVLNGYLLARFGQTIGKRLVGTRIVSVEDDRIVSFGKVIMLRYVPIWVISQIPVIGGLFGIVDSLFVFRADRRCIHDLIAGTRVVNATGG